MSISSHDSSSRFNIPEVSFKIGWNSLVKVVIVTHKKSLLSPTTSRKWWLQDPWMVALLLLDSIGQRNSNPLIQSQIVRWRLPARGGNLWPLQLWMLRSGSLHRRCDSLCSPLYVVKLQGLLRNALQVSAFNHMYWFSITSRSHLQCDKRTTRLQQKTVRRKLWSYHVEPHVSQTM